MNPHATITTTSTTSATPIPHSFAPQQQQPQFFDPAQAMPAFQFSPGVQAAHHLHSLNVQHQQDLYQQQAAFEQLFSMYQKEPSNTNKKIQSKADRRAEHNAIERARRESLNTKFQQLAHSLPNLQNDSRPSKSTIIERTLEFVKQALQREERYKHDIRDLRQVNRQLLKQLSNVTNCHHQPPPSTSTATTTTTTATSSPMYCSPVNTAIMMTTSTAPTIASATFVPPAVQQDPTWEQFDSLNDSSLFSQSPGPTSSSPCEDSEDEVDDLEGQLPHSFSMTTKKDHARKAHPTMGQFQVKCEPAIYN